MGSLVSPNRPMYGAQPILIGTRTSTPAGGGRRVSRRANSGGSLPLHSSSGRYSTPFNSTSVPSFSRPRSASFGHGPTTKKSFSKALADSLSGYRSNRYPLVKGGSLSERSSRTSSLASVTSNSSTDWSPGADFKQLYENEKVENEKLMERIRQLEEVLNGSELQDQNGLIIEDGEIEAQLRAETERQTLDRRISELEKIAKSLEQLRLDNQKLKEENGALIRVISKLSR